MNATESGTEPLLAARAQVSVSATPELVYQVVSDLPRSAEWSPECLGGEWVSGVPGAVGSVFRGHNHRTEDVVAWAPVVRGGWRTESEVISAEPGRSFRWSMRDSRGTKQDSVWSYELEPAEGGCLLTHHFRMGAATEGIREITAEMDEIARRRFFSEWQEKLAGDVEATVRRIKDIVEK
jgi:polyketide cyclase/dehydrase/lipid transport protein